MQIMKKTTIFTLLLLVTGIVANSAPKKKEADPVVITVGDCKVHLSEFEYLYKKNNAQQQTDLTLDRYIDMFVKYKMKVEAARAAGLDTAQTYLVDMSRYGRELAEPYMTDKEMCDSLVKAAYSHYGKVVRIHHILLPANVQGRTPAQQKALADSIHGLIDAGADFEDLARRFSSDPMVAETSGRMTIAAGLLPYGFEDMAYRTPVGECSPVFSTNFGYHMLRVDSREKSDGEIKARHILKLTRGLDEVASAEKKARIDSIYDLLQSGADFDQIASSETEDSSGKNNGGALPWFGRGMMVPEFEEAAFALADGEISQPVKTVFGYHIVKREASRPVQPIDSLREYIQSRIDSDYRSILLHRRAVDKYASEINVKINHKFFDKAAGIIKREGSLNEAARKAISEIKTPVMTIGNQKYMPSELRIPSEAVGIDDLKAAIDDFRYMKLIDLMYATLSDREPDYRNLYNEYSDGMLLFEISNREVWERANKDTEGLEAYFLTHRDKYKWDAPHYRGFVISAVSDSLADQAMAYLGTLTVADDQLSTELRKKFGTHAKIERVNAGKGDHAIIDYVAFGGEKPEPNGRWTSFRPFRGDIAEQPQTAMDVKGLVGMDYQQQLENEWIDGLKSTFKVTVDRQALSQFEQE